MDELFENPGLCHIGSKIYNYLNLQTKLTCRLVRKSWNDMFEKQASKCDLQKVVNWSKFLSEPKWKDFLKELKTRIPTSVLKLLLRLINSSEEFKYRTPLLAFAIIGNSKIVDFILNMNTITISNNEYNEALDSAVKYGHVNVAKCLKAFRNYKAILTATKYGHLEVLKVLMDDVIDTNTELVDWKTIRTAVCSGKIEMIKYFEEKLSKDWLEELLTKKDRLGRTSIHYAALHGHLEIVKFLALFTSNPNSPDNEGLTPSEYARSKGFFEIDAYLSNLK